MPHRRWSDEAKARVLGEAMTVDSIGFTPLELRLARDRCWCFGSSVNEVPMTKLVHNPFSQDIYADAAVGFFTYNGNMRITLESVRSDYTQEPIATDRVVVGRLVMPVAAAEALAKGILEQLERLKAESAIQRSTTVQ